MSEKGEDHKGCKGPVLAKNWGAVRSVVVGVKTVLKKKGKADPKLNSQRKGASHLRTGVQIGLQDRRGIERRGG